MEEEEGEEENLDFHARLGNSELAIVAFAKREQFLGV
jgi:hypothetical protein